MRGADAVDALTDMTVSGTLSADPLYVNYPLDLHLSAGSPCQDAGTTAGAPCPRPTARPGSDSRS
jgi:hypothetical protein